MKSWMLIYRHGLRIGEFGLASSTDISVGFIRDPYGSFKVRE